MTGTEFIRRVEIPVPQPLVWSVLVDVERWPEWMPSVSHVKRLSAGPLQVASRARVYQPKLPPASWRVTELEAGAGFTWESIAPGLRVVAGHWPQPTGGGCRVTLSIRYEGLFGPWLARWVGELNDRYLDLEANGLKARCVALAAEPSSLKS
jgi:uncharacterized membrane protein